jgi:hypothetical protein
MAIRTSGPLPITEIVTEFGGSVPHGLSEYYGNGVFLSKGYFPPTPAIPISPNPLSISNFYGKTRKVPVTVEITANTSNVNAFSLFRTTLAQYSNVDVSATLIVRSGVTVSGSLTIPPNDPTRANGFRSTDDFVLINNGNIVGNNGTGGAGGAGPSGIGANGSNGSTPLIVQRVIQLNNLGTIAGGANGGKGGNGGTKPGTTETGCQQNCTVYNYTSKKQWNCQNAGNSEERCDDARTMGVMNRYNGQCDCGTCDGGRGCRRSQQMGFEQQKMSCRTYSNQCQQTAITVNTGGGTGGNGAPPTNRNGATAGTAGGGGTATAGATGGGWGGVPWVSGYVNISNKASIGGTLLGGES